MVQNFGKRQHAFGLGADIHHDVCRRELQHGAANHAVFTDRFFSFGGEGLEGGGEIFRGGSVVLSWGWFGWRLRFSSHRVLSWRLRFVL